MKEMLNSGEDHVGVNILMDGTYWIVIEIFQPLDTTVSFYASSVVVGSVTVTQMATSSNLVMITAVLTHTVISTSALPQTQLSGSQMDPSTLMAIIILVVVAVVAGLVFMFRSRGKKP